MQARSRLRQPAGDQPSAHEGRHARPSVHAPLPDRERVAETVRRLHREVDAQAARLVVMHEQRLRCRLGCTECCQDDIRVFDIEADVIRQAHRSLLDGGTPHAEGACAFLDSEGACRIYAHRPYVCRTQGLPLRWLDETDEGAVVEMRDICPLNDDDFSPVEALEAEACWTIGPFEEALATLEERWDGGEMRRIPLRDLFTQASPA